MREEVSDRYSPKRGLFKTLYIDKVDTLKVTIRSPPLPPSNIAFVIIINICFVSSFI